MNSNAEILQMSNFKEIELKLGEFGNFGFQSVDSYLHRHGDYYEIILGISGVYEHTYNGDKTNLSRGTLLLLTPYSVHQLYTEPMQATHFVVCIEQNYFKEFVDQHFPKFSSNALPELSTVYLNEKETEYLEFLCHQLCTPRPSEHTSEKITYLTLMNVFTQMSKQRNESVYYVDRILSILSNPVNLNISAKHLCEQFSESTPTILKNFKKQTGYTIVQYKNKKKMEMATEMLRNSSTPITDIAYDLHYESLSYFLRAFKQEYGITPTEYRQKYLSK